MKNLKSSLLALTLISSGSRMLAKRVPPKPVPSVELDGTRYSAPHDFLMGSVVATDIRTNFVIWKRQIYVVKFNQKIEGDVQSCYITNLKLESGKLQVTNELGNLFELDLNTLKVRTIKGSLLVQRRSD